MVTPLSPVTNSSNIAEQGYDEGTRTLAVRFKSGRLYHYLNVPAEEAQGFVDADSLGKYLVEKIKPVYEAMPIDEDTRDDV